MDMIYGVCFFTLFTLTLESRLIRLILKQTNNFKLLHQVKKTKRMLTRYKNLMIYGDNHMREIFIGFDIILLNEPN